MDLLRAWSLLVKVNFFHQWRTAWFCFKEIHTTSNFLTRVSLGEGTGEFSHQSILPGGNGGISLDSLTRVSFGGRTGEGIKDLYILFYLLFGNFQPNAAKFPTMIS